MKIDVVMNQSWRNLRYWHCISMWRLKETVGVLSLPPWLDGSNSLPTSSRGTTFELRAAHEGLVIIWSTHTFPFYISNSDVAFSLREDLRDDSEDTEKAGEIILIQGSGTEQEDIVIHFTSSAEWGRSNRWENFSVLGWLRQLNHKIFFENIFVRMKEYIR